MTDQTPQIPDPSPEFEERELSDQTPRMMGLVAIMTIITFLVYGLGRLLGQPPLGSLMFAAYVNGAAFGLAFVLMLVKSSSYGWLMCMMASAATLTGVCFTLSHSTKGLAFLGVGAAVLFIAVLSSLFKNIDDRVKFTPMVISILASTMLILLSLSF